MWVGMALLCQGSALPRWLVRACALRKLFLEGVSFHRIIPPFGVVTGFESPNVSSRLPRWREVVMCANQ